MNKTKYIIAQVDKYTFVPIVFSDYLVHADVAQALGFYGKIVGAGFCFVEDGPSYAVYGESTSLKVKSREEDIAILNTILG